MYCRNSNLYCQWSRAERRDRSMEQQQSCNSHCKRCRISHSHICRHMQYHLYNNRRLRRNSFCPKSSNSQFKCRYHFSNRSFSFMYREYCSLFCQWSCSERGYRSMEQQQSSCSHGNCSRNSYWCLSGFMQHYLYNNRGVRKYRICPAIYNC